MIDDSNSKKDVVFSTAAEVKEMLPSLIDDEVVPGGFFKPIPLPKPCANDLKAIRIKQKVAEVRVTSENCLRPLECVAQNYAWGKVGSRSMVARMKKEADKDTFPLEETKPYSELWLGTHTNGMSRVSGVDAGENGTTTQTPLADYVSANPQLHCGRVGDITFLFKILSIEKVLSIQAHPDKTLAARLHAERPNVYKDPNHKPEMAIALSDDFQAMCGFRPLVEIAHNLKEFPEFQAVVGTEATDHISRAAQHPTTNNPRPALQHFFRAYMEANYERIVLPNLNRMLDRLHQIKEKKSSLVALILKFSQQFPGDAGIFSPLLFNHVQLKKGQAFFMSANEPHAYIQGEIMECMACSDNVVRCGLTPKLKDVEVLVNMLTYNCQMPEITTGIEENANCRLYLPPVQDFALEVVTVKAGETYVLNSVQSPSVLLTLEGTATIEQGSTTNLFEASFGKAAFMSANTSATIRSTGTDFKLVRALSNVFL